MIGGEIFEHRPRGGNGPAIRKFSRGEYYQMADLGWFDDLRVELINGEILRWRRNYISTTSRLREQRKRWNLHLGVDSGFEHRGL